MADSLMRRVGRFAGVAVWTLAVGASLWAVDRAVIGTPEPLGWIEARSIQAVPAEAGPVLVPSYLPQNLGWPPHRVLYATRGAHGVWLGFQPPGAAEVELWIGYQEGSLPRELGALAECAEDARPLGEASSAECPTPWRAFSTRAVDGRAVVVMTRLEESEARKIARHLDEQPP